MIIQVGSKVLALDYQGLNPTLDLDEIDRHFKLAEVTAIRSNNMLCDVRFLHDNRISRAMLIVALRKPT